MEEIFEVGEEFVRGGILENLIASFENPTVVYVIAVVCVTFFVFLLGRQGRELKKVKEAAIRHKQNAAEWEQKAKEHEVGRMRNKKSCEYFLGLFTSDQLQNISKGLKSQLGEIGRLKALDEKRMGELKKIEEDLDFYKNLITIADEFSQRKG